MTRVFACVVIGIIAAMALIGGSAHAHVVKYNPYLEVLTQLPRTSSGSRILYSGPPWFPLTSDCRYINKQTGFIDKTECTNISINHGTFTLTYIPGKDINNSDRLMIFQGLMINSMVYTGDFRHLWPRPQWTNPTQPNYVSVSSVPAVIKNTGMPYSSGIDIVFKGNLPAGTPVYITFGNISQGSPGMEIPAFDSPMQLIAMEDLTINQQPGGGVKQPKFALFQTDYPTLNISATRPDQFHVFAPLLPHSRSITILVKAVEGRQGNHTMWTNSFTVHNYTGTIAFSSSDPAAVLPPPYTFRASDRGVKRFNITLSPGTQTVTVRDVSDHSKNGTSNPIVMRRVPRNRQIFTGVLHHHTAMGGHSAGTPVGAYTYARNEADLDFLAVSDHCNHQFYNWSYLMSLPDKFYEPGSFVTFGALEWTQGTNGHRHIIWKNVSGQTEICEVKNTNNPNATVAANPQALYSALKTTEAIAIVHHSQWGIVQNFTWGNMSNPNTSITQRLVEMYSWHGSSEEYNTSFPIGGSVTSHLPPSRNATVQDAFAMGLTLGVTAGDDVHFSKPGAFIGRNSRYSWGGITMVYADNLTRDSIWNALLDRRVYGTTGARIYLNFMVNSRGMGSRIDIHEKPTLSVEAVGTSPITKIIIFRDGKTPVYVYNGTGQEASFKWTDTSFAPGEKHNYYIHLEQADGHQAWSSPVWVTLHPARTAAWGLWPLLNSAVRNMDSMLRIV